MNNPPHDWDDVAFDDFGEIVAGGTPSRAVPSFWNGDIPWVTPSEITALKNKHLRETREQITREGLASSAAKLLPPGTLLVTSRATLGEVAIAGVSVSTNQGFKNIIPNEATDSLFAYYRIGTLKPEMERRASGTTFLEISKADFSRIRTLRPNRAEQSRIAAVLDTVDEAIAKTEAVIAKLIKQVRAGLLHDLLTRGLDENGQLRDPIAHPEQFQDSLIARIPRGWFCGALSEVAWVNPVTRFNGLNPKNLVSFIPMHDVDDEGYWINRQFRELESLGGGYTAFQEDDILFAKITPCMENGKGCHAVSLVNGYGLGSTEFHVLRAKKSDCSRFVFHWAKMANLRKRAEAFMTGSAGQQRVEAAFFDRYLIAHPPKHEQKHIVAIVDLVEHDLETHGREAKKLQQLKSALMTDLLTGRVRVPADLEFG